jgi:ketosteroid isomerase-like protein
MSRENVELAYRAIDAFSRRDLDAYLELVDADVEFAAGGVTMEGDYHGHAGVRRFWDNLLGVLPDLTIVLVEMRDLGDRTLGAGRARPRRR